ncbi:MlaD family protein, partial [Parasediminibacterium sp. JCM 36343]|uniref:MlaD family protein n=1 Tax=Parasediminibacterium sp. JCM 36343 TaxID=3374279 RepID=UPI003978B3CB
FNQYNKTLNLRFASMKISNETKVGALTAVAIALLILGFNFLKGKSLFKTGNYLFAKYSNTKGLMVSNGVFINGYKIGAVYEIENADPELKEMIVTIKLNDKYNIAKNAVASIKENPLGSPSIDIVMGNDTHFLSTGDTILTGENEGLLSGLGSKLAPVGDQLKTTMHSLDSVLNNINNLMDPNFKGNLQQSFANLNRLTASLAVSAAGLQVLLNAQTGALTQTMNNANSFTKNLADNNNKVTKMMSNLEKTTENFSKTDIDGTVASLKATIDKLNGIVDKVDNKEGTLGLFINDKTLYNNLTNTIRSANILVDDLKLHPKRYVSISVFGKKDNSKPLTAPLPLNDSIHP